jgi:hypothetical protein
MITIPSAIASLLPFRLGLIKSGPLTNRETDKLDAFLLSDGGLENAMDVSTLDGFLFKSRARLEAEIVFLRHQLNISLRRAPPRVRLRGSDRALLVWMTRLWPSYWVRCKSFSRRPSCGGIVRGLRPSGAGNLDVGEGGPG